MIYLSIYLTIYPSILIIATIIKFFCSQALTALLSDDSKFGFIVIDGSGALFGTLQGNTREVLHKFTVDLPKKHGKRVFKSLAVTPVLLYDFEFTHLFPLTFF